MCEFLVAAMLVFLSLDFCGWSLMYNFGFWEWAASDVEGFLFQQTSQLPSLGWPLFLKAEVTCVGVFGAAELNSMVGGDVHSTFHEYCVSAILCILEQSLLSLSAGTWSLWMLVELHLSAWSQRQSFVSGCEQGQMAAVKLQNLAVWLMTCWVSLSCVIKL
jgi:hypothetical protein